MRISIRVREENILSLRDRIDGCTPRPASIAEIFFLAQAGRTIDSGYLNLERARDSWSWIVQFIHLILVIVVQTIRSMTIRIMTIRIMPPPPLRALPHQTNADNMVTVAR